MEITEIWPKGHVPNDVEKGLLGSLNMSEFDFFTDEQEKCVRSYWIFGLVKFQCKEYAAI